MKHLFVTYIIAAVGVGVFHLLDLPLPWLIGPIVACLIAALAGVPMKGNKLVNDAMRSILGVAVGATFTMTILASMISMWPTLLMIPVMVAAIGLIGIPYFQRIWGFDFATSYYCAMPGGLQDMLAFGEEAGGDVRALSLVHATRVMVVVVALPFILQGYWDVDLSSPPGEPASSIAPSQLIIMVLCGLIGWRVAKALGMFGSSILGPLILAAILALLGILHHRPPAEAIWMAQFFIGMTVGAKYAGVTMPEVRKDVSAALGFCVILIVMTVIFAEIIHLAGLAPPMETLLAFAPGGQAEMTVLALVVGADMAFVIAHHVLRIFVVILGAPIAAKILNPRQQG
ncbi:AbrB family transcriptional regulator [Pacificibacter marinus]|uniref:AbrB family transcriptional regulator n=1 Tax=Pacificibacter marinus TaxID=658057 RepID=UPI001C073AD7|nr:AbrB family transcriptional regulator [Pacificibacter marinus]MBU2865787.1 AbrB family transcriptional regulator [Pacificibacter marinus]